MGLERDALDFLAAAKASGASFRASATLGRQAVALPRKPLLDAYSLAGCTPATQPKRVMWGPVDPILRDFGAEEVVSIDNSDYEGASRVHDMNTEISRDLVDRFSMVLDSGTLEHIFDFPTAIRNCMRMVAPGGHLVIVTPTNNEAGHGFYQFSPELFYRVLAPRYGFEVEEMLLRDKGSRRRSWYRVSDPDDVGARAQFRTRSVTYLYVRARRIGPVPPFDQAPQQSDYAAHWEQRGRPPAERTSIGALMRAAGRLLPGLKRLYLSWTPRTRAMYRRQDYRHLQQHFRRVEGPDALVRTPAGSEPPVDSP